MIEIEGYTAYCNVCGKTFAVPRKPTAPNSR